jgi:hypothetical protein
MKKTSVYEWYKRFQDDCKEVEDEERSCWPSTSIIENVKKVRKNGYEWSPKHKIRGVADEVGISSWLMS